MARNDQGETPKDLAHRFYKQAVVDYVDNLEYEKEHAEDEESEIFFYKLLYCMSFHLTLYIICIIHVMSLTAEYY